MYSNHQRVNYQNTHLKTYKVNNKPSYQPTAASLEFRFQRLDQNRGSV